MTDNSLPVVLDLAELTSLVQQRPELFLRYSKGPDQDAAEGPSVDYEADVQLPGLSVTTIAPEPWWPRPAVDWIARRVCKYIELGLEDGRRPWLLSGRIVGYGPDHEPLVTDARPVAWVSFDAVEEALRHYRGRFNVGRDSRGG